MSQKKINSSFQKNKVDVPAADSSSEFSEEVPRSQKRKEAASWSLFKIGGGLGVVLALVYLVWYLYDRNETAKVKKARYV